MNPSTATGPAAIRLAEFVCRAAGDDLPAPLMHEAKRAILNFTGSMLGGRNDRLVEMLGTMARATSGPGEATVVGSPDRLDALSASFLNAISGSVLEFDDTHHPTVMHPTATVLPPLLALVDRHGGSGKDLLTAFVIGVDVACRIGLAMSPGHYRRGWHVTTTCGIFGASAGSACLLGFDADRTANAIAGSASLSSGLVENFASDAKNIAIGMAARNGLLSALAAGRGATASPRALDGERGLAAATGGHLDIDVLLDSIGARWELMRTAYKAYPCGVVLSAVIDACLTLRQDGIRAGEIDHVTVSGDALLLERTDRAHVVDGSIGKVSLQHVAAIAFIEGRVGPAHFLASAVEDTAVCALRRRIHAKLDASLPPMAATVQVATRNGATMSRTILTPIGSPENQLSDIALAGKTTDLCRYGGSACRADEIIEACWALDRAPDARTFLALLREPRRS